MLTLRHSVVGLALALFASSFPPAYAADSGGGSSGDQPVCRAGYVYNKQKQICEPQQSGVLPDGDLAEYAYLLAKNERYDEALAVLDLMADPDTPIALNYRGYATRKLGKVDEGISFYLQSVALDPQYPHVREYLGEAYIAKGDIDLARQQLAAIESLCGTTCEYYLELAEEIAAAEKPAQQ
ncbi:MAG: tetratricopeptide repeat protein [Propylenella sp.]